MIQSLWIMRKHESWIFFALQHPKNPLSHHLFILKWYILLFILLVNTYFIISKEPEPGGLVVFIVRDAQVVCSRLQNGVFVPTLHFGFIFYHLTGVQGCLHTQTRCNVKGRRWLTPGRPRLSRSRAPPRLFPAARFPRTLKRHRGERAEAAWAASWQSGDGGTLPSMSAASPSSSSSSSSSAHVADVAFMFLSWDSVTF